MCINKILELFFHSHQYPTFTFTFHTHIHIHIHILSSPTNIYIQHFEWLFAWQRLSTLCVCVCIPTDVENNKLYMNAKLVSRMNWHTFNFSLNYILVEHQPPPFCPSSPRIPIKPCIENVSLHFYICLKKCSIFVAVKQLNFIMIFICHFYCNMLGNVMQWMS